MFWYVFNSSSLVFANINRYGKFGICDICLTHQAWTTKMKMFRKIQSKHVKLLEKKLQTISSYKLSRSEHSKGLKNAF